MCETILNRSESLYDYSLTFLNQYVELYTYFSLYPLYGEVLEITPFTLVLSSNYIGSLDVTYNEIYSFYIPLNSIISIKKI